MQHSAITSDRDYDRVERAIRFIADHRLEQPSLEEVADAMGVSPFHAQRVFSSWAGVSPKRFLGLLTVEHAKSLLRADESVLGAAFEVGLSGGSRLHDLFVGFEAITPGEYKSMGADLVLRWGVHETPFGPALFVASERGLARLTFLDGGHLDHALAEAKADWPLSRFVEDAEATRGMAAAAFGPRDGRGTVAAVRQGHAVPDPGLARADAGARGHRHQLRRPRRRARPPRRRARRRPRLRRQPHRRPHPLPPRDPRDRRARRISVGPGAQAGGAGLGECAALQGGGRAPSRLSPARW